MYLYILSSFSQHLIYVQKRTSRTKSKKIGIIKFIHIPSLYLLAKPAEHTPLALFASSALIAHAVIAPMTSPVQWQNLTHITVGDWKYHLPVSSRRPSPSARVVLAGASLIFSRVFFCTSRSRSCWFSPRCCRYEVEHDRQRRAAWRSTTSVCLFYSWTCVLPILGTESTRLPMIMGTNNRCTAPTGHPVDPGGPPHTT